MRSTFHSRRWRLMAAALMMPVAAVASAIALTQSASATVTTLATFSTPGTYVWTVPTGVTAVTFDVYGARGGSVLSNDHGIVNVVSQGGAGGEAKARFTVHAGEKFEIVVGGQGGSATQGVFGGGGAGLNGGGSGEQNDVCCYAAGGGGGSDVRIGGRGNPCAGSKTCGFGDRVIVAGGGGGGGPSQPYGDGGGGGGLNGLSTNPAARNATQEIGAKCSSNFPGLFGTGGSGHDSGGGGGGWYGGCAPTRGNGGSGGSGYINPLSISGSFPGGKNAGDGKVIITT